MKYLIQWEAGKNYWSTMLEHEVDYSEEEYRALMHTVMQNAAYALLRLNRTIGLPEILMETARILKDKHGFTQVEKQVARVIGFGGGKVLTEEQDSDLAYIFGEDLLGKVFWHNNDLTDKKIKLMGQIKKETQDAEAKVDGQATGGHENEGGASGKAAS